MPSNYTSQFKESMNRLHFSSDDKKRIYNNLTEAIQSSKEKKDEYMKKWSFPKVAAIAVTCLMITGVTTLAVSKITVINSNSGSDYDYNSIAEMTTAQSDIKGNRNKTMPEFPESIGDGYSFDGGNITHENGMDDTGNTIETWDNLDGTYKNYSGNTLYLSMSYMSLYDDENAPVDTEVRTINGITVNYNYDEYLFLPADDEEKETESDIKERLDNDEHFHVSYGSDKPETKYSSSVSFVKDGINFSIYSYDDVSADELFSIAEELIIR